RLAAAATSGLSATRDLADWLLAQMSPEAARPEPREMPITRIPVPASPPTLGTVPSTWILTASVDNHRVTESLGFSVVGIKERNRARAMEMEQGDLIVFYLTKVMAFAGAVRITGDLFEDRGRLWPGQPSKPDLYPWRFQTEPVVALPQDRWVPAASLKTELEHVQKWPAENWTLAFQSQLRTVSAHDSTLLLERLQAAAPQPA
ncbi:MAG: EVE domain-containing protein, partial [Solirubrobacteraceae bacterium]|nr:EVE domain-containing protein [Solirubrobacteraceae bacterium]